MSEDRTRYGNGEGSAPKKRKDGRWAVNSTVGRYPGKDGRIVPDRRTVYGATAGEARRRAQNLTRQAENGTLSATGSPTFEQWMAYWLDGPAKDRVVPSTLGAYRSLNKICLTPELDHLRLEKVTEQHIEQLYAAMRDAGRAPTYVQKAHRVLSRALKVAVQKRRLAKHPCEHLDAPKAPGCARRPSPATMPPGSSQQPHRPKPSPLGSGPVLRAPAGRDPRALLGQR